MLMWPTGVFLGCDDVLPVRRDSEEQQVSVMAGIFCLQ